LKSQVESQSTCSDLVTRNLDVISCPGTREEYDECNDSAAANHTEPVFSSALDVLPTLSFPVATSENRTALLSSTKKNKAAVNEERRTCKGVCIGNLNHLGVDDFGVNPVCKADIDRCPQFIGRINRGPKVPCYVIIRNNEEYLPSMEIEYIDKLILMWQAVDMDDYHIKASGLKVNKNIFSVSLYLIFRHQAHKQFIQNRRNACD